MAKGGTDAEPADPACLSTPPTYSFILFTRSSTSDGPATDSFPLDYVCDGEPVDIVTGRAVEPDLNYLVIRTHTGRAGVFFPGIGCNDGIMILPGQEVDLVFCDKGHIFAAHRETVWDVVVGQGSAEPARMYQAPGPIKKFLSPVNDSVLCHFLTDDFLMGSLRDDGSIDMLFEGKRVLCADSTLGCMAVLTSELELYEIVADGGPELTTTVSEIPAGIHRFGRRMVKLEETSGSLQLGKNDVIEYSICYKRTRLKWCSTDCSCIWSKSRPGAPATCLFRAKPPLQIVAFDQSIVATDDEPFDVVLIQRDCPDGVRRALSKADDPEVCRRILTSYVGVLTGQFVESLHPLDCRLLFRGLRAVFNTSEDLWESCLQVLPRVVRAIGVMEMVQFLDDAFFSNVLKAAPGFAPVSLACIAQLAGYALKRSPYAAPPGWHPAQRVKQPSRRNLQELQHLLFPHLGELPDDVGRSSLDGLLAIYPYGRGDMTDLADLCLKHADIVRPQEIRRLIGLTLQRSLRPHMAAKVCRLTLRAFGWSGLGDKRRRQIMEFWTRADTQKGLQIVLDEFVNVAIVAHVRPVVRGAVFRSAGTIGRRLAAALKVRLPVPGGRIDEILEAPGVVQAVMEMAARAAELIQLRRQLMCDMEIANALTEMTLEQLL
jgi:hypothetical protein